MRQNGLTCLTLGFTQLPSRRNVPSFHMFPGAGTRLGTGLVSTPISSALNYCGHLLKRGTFLMFWFCWFPCRPVRRCETWSFVPPLGHMRVMLGACVATQPCTGRVTLQAARCRQVATRLHPELQLPCGAGLQAFCKFRTYAVHSETVDGCVFSLGSGIP